MLLEQDLYYELSYEALIANPPEECAKLCKFLGVPYEDAMLHFRKRRERTEPGLDAKRAWQPVTSGLRDWRPQMPTGDVERFEAAAGDLLDELGYARAVPRPSPEALQHARKIRHSFRARPARSGGPVAGAWASVNPYVSIVGGAVGDDAAAAHGGRSSRNRRHPRVTLVPRFYVKRIGLALTARSRWSSLRGCSTTAGSSSWASKGETWKVSSLGCAIPYADYVTRIFNLYGQVRGKRLVGEKTPGNVRNIPTLHYLCPKRGESLTSSTRKAIFSAWGHKTLDSGANQLLARRYTRSFCSVRRGKDGSSTSGWPSPR